MVSIFITQEIITREAKVANSLNIEPYIYGYFYGFSGSLVQKTLSILDSVFFKELVVSEYLLHKILK